MVSVQFRAHKAVFSEKKNVTQEYQAMVTHKNVFNTMTSFTLNSHLCHTQQISPLVTGILTKSLKILRLDVLYLKIKF